MRGTIIKGSIRDWFHREYPHIPLDMVHVSTNGSIDQTLLDPYASRVILLTKPIDSTKTSIIGIIYYGSEDIHPHQSLSFWTPPPSEPYDPPDPPDPPDVMTMQQIESHVDWIISGQGEWNYQCMQLLLCVGACIPEFFALQMAKEEKQFSTPSTERGMAHLLRPFAAFLDLMEDPPTVLDLQSIYPRPKPTIWFNVPMEQYPPGRILYPGGVYHVPCIDMGPWLWRHLTRNSGIRRKRHPDQMMHILSYIVQRLRDRVRDTTPPVPVVTDPTIRMAPCLRKMLNSGQFPPDNQRQWIVRIWKRVGVSVDYVGQVLDALNDRYPHQDGRYMTAKRRWDYEHHYSAGYGPPTCETLCDVCPFEGPMDQRKTACYKEFVERFGFMPNPRRFRGPASWYEW